MENNQQPLTKKQRRELKKQEKMQAKQQEQKQKKMTQIFVWVGIVVLVGAGIYGIMQMEGSGGNKTVQIDTIDQNVDHTKGNPDAGVTLVEYSDFQCPYCALYPQIINDLMDEYGDQVYFAFRYFPLSSIHSNAQVAAQAAEAAGNQDKFWEMHDKLFENQDEWSSLGDPSEKFASYAQDLGIDMERFNADLGSEAIKDRVNGDYDSATAAGLNSTPSFILNGEKIDNPPTLDDFKKVIDKKIGVDTETQTENTNSEETNTNK